MISLAHPLRRHAALLALVISGALLLPGCAPLVVGGTAATTAIVAIDRRTTGEQVEDQAIELKISNELRQRIPDRARITPTSYAGVVLLTGDVPSEAHKRLAEETAAKVEKVQRVINRLRVGEVTPLSVRSNDTWLTSKVRTALINTQDVPAGTIVIQTERGITYLMGRVTEQEAQRAAKAAASVKGVNQVVTLFEIISQERANSAPMDNTAAPTAAPSTSAAPTAGQPAPATGGVEILPIQ